MGWLGIAAAVAALVAVGVRWNAAGFAGRVARETREMWRGGAPARPLARERLDSLPGPVRTYLVKALGDRERPVATVRFRHGGRFRTALDGPWRAIRGEQYEAADPPGFVWWGRLRAGPGVWVDARDCSVNGTGAMLVSLESSFTIADRTGPEMDQGSLLRLLSDLVLFPTAFLDDRYVEWAAIDDGYARASLRVGGREVAGVFAFGPDGLPRGFSARRYFDPGRGTPELREWSGDYEDYRSAGGMLVPHRFVGYWHAGEERVPYVDFRLDTPEYDLAAPF
jgi:hypothetical protein